MKKVLIIQANYQFMPGMGGELNKLIATKTKDILEKKDIKWLLIILHKNIIQKKKFKK